jgi:hypothetical protein
MIRPPDLAAALKVVKTHQRARAKESKAVRLARARAHLKASDERQRKPRERDNVHLAFIRRLPCVATYVETGIFVYGCQAAHLRLASAKHRKPIAGRSMKPDDCWVTPLLPEQHRIQGDVKGEAKFWSDLGVDPFQLCIDLFAASGDEGRARDVIREAAHHARYKGAEG